MKIIATVKAVDTGNCIGAQVEFHDYRAKVREHAQVYAVMLKAIYGAANDFVETLPRESKLVFAESMAASLGHLRAEVWGRSGSGIGLFGGAAGKPTKEDLKEVIKNLKLDAESEGP